MKIDKVASICVFFFSLKIRESPESHFAKAYCVFGFILLCLQSSRCPFFYAQIQNRSRNHPKTVFERAIWPICFLCNLIHS